MRLPLRWWARRLMLRALTVPSGAPPGRNVPPPEPRQVRLLALLAVRDEATELPGHLANVAPHVDGIIALDDGSTDGTGALLAAHPSVLEVLRVPADRPSWNDVENHRRLVAAGLRHGAEWLLALDADERIECDFRQRAERVIARGTRLGFTAYAVRFRELWDDETRFRADGIWGAKTQPRLFRARADHAFDERPMHGAKAPLQSMWRGRRLPVADLFIYHRGMLTPEDRYARRARYEQLDPRELAQPGIGYAYLTDERGLRCKRVPSRRGYVAGASGATGGERRVSS